MTFYLFYTLLILSITLGLGLILALGYIAVPSRVKRMIHTFFYLEELK
ncbi:hypothetical protein KYJ26_20380 [Bacillus sp. MCCB 382]|nr:hypothetical protein [Bacillus sp. MCCB 382]